MAKRRLSDDEKPNPYFMCKADYLQTEIVDCSKMTAQQENMFNQMVRDEPKDPISDYVKQIIEQSERKYQEYQECIERGQQYEKLKFQGVHHKKFKPN